jgi:predicted methyltransferase
VTRRVRHRASSRAAPSRCIAAAVADPARPEADRKRDELRKPDAMLAFMQVRPGLSVFDVEAGDGYLTELFSRAVGSQGSVVMQNPKEFRNFVGDKIDARLVGNRLRNVRVSYSYLDALDAANDGTDLVAWVWGPMSSIVAPTAATPLSGTPPLFILKSSVF